MKKVLLLLVTGCLMMTSHLIAQEKTIANLSQAYRFEFENSQLFKAYAQNAEEQNLPKLATFFRAISEAAAVHASNFEKVLSRMGTIISPPEVTVVYKTPQIHVDEALKRVRIEAGIKYAEYLEQAREDGERNATKAIRWAKETQQESLPLFVKANSAVINGTTNTLPDFYWLCPKCGNLYDVPNPEKECSYCFTEREKFEKIK